MLQIADEHMVALPQRAVNCEIERVGAVCSEDSVLRFGTEQRRGTHSGFVDERSRASCEDMTAAPRIAARAADCP